MTTQKRHTKKDYFMSRNILDWRSESRAREDYERGKEKEVWVMIKLTTEYVARGIPNENISYKPVDPTEKWMDGKRHIEPD